MNTNENATYERTHYEATLDVRYGVQFANLSARLYRRIDLMFGAVCLASGTAAFAGAMADRPMVSAVAGATIAAAAILERLIRPVEKAVACEALARRFGDLDAQAGTQSLDALDASLRKLQADPTPCFDGLAVAAHNRNLASHGRAEYALPRSTWCRYLEFFA
jgi:hypothetical protein